MTRGYALDPRSPRSGAIRSDEPMPADPASSPVNTGDTTGQAPAWAAQSYVPQAPAPAPQDNMQRGLASYFGRPQGPLQQQPMMGQAPGGGWAGGLSSQRPPQQMGQLQFGGMAGQMGGMGPQHMTGGGYGMGGGWGAPQRGYGSYGLQHGMGGGQMGGWGQQPQMQQQIYGAMARGPAQQQMPPAAPQQAPQATSRPMMQNQQPRTQSRGGY
jgi:hypothetical protein